MESKINDLILELKSLIKQTKSNTEKLFFELIKKDTSLDFKKFLNHIEESIEECPKCFYIKINGVCDSCDSNRKQNKICVVSSILDAKTILDKDVFDGVFHVLGGEIDLHKNVSPIDLKINQLFDRINNEEVEVIIALNATFKGELTSNYLAQELKNKKIRVSKIARGIPFGGVINYIDKETIDNALKKREKI